MSVDHLIELLIKTADEDAETRAQAEENLSGTDPSEGTLTDIAYDEENDLNVRMAAFNWLKNRIYVYPEPVNTPGFTIRLPDSPIFITWPTEKDLRVARHNDWTLLIKTDPSKALDLWNRLEGEIPTLNECGIVTTNCTTFHSRSITYIRELEPEEHEYGVTISFINMLNNFLISRHSELQSPQIQHSVILDTCLKLVTNLVFLKVELCQFDKTEEKWAILNLCIQTYYLILSGYEPAKNGNAKSSFKLMSQILQDGELFNCIFMNLENAINQLTSDLISYSKSPMDDERVYAPDGLLEEHVSLVLLLFNCVAEKQDDFLKLIKEIPDYPTTTNVEMGKLIGVENPRTGSVDRLATLLKILVLTSDKTSVLASGLLKRVKDDTEMRIAILGLILEADRGLQTSSRVARESKHLGPNGMRKINWKEDGKNLVVEIDLPQFKPEEVNIEFCDDNLVVEAKTESSEDDSYYKSQFERRVRLPAGVNYEAIESIFTPDSKLLVEMPMNKPSSRSFKIPINIKRLAIEEAKEGQPDQEQKQHSQEMGDSSF